MLLNFFQLRKIKSLLVESVSCGDKENNLSQRLAKRGRRLDRITGGCNAEYMDLN